MSPGRERGHRVILRVNLPKHSREDHHDDRTTQSQPCPTAGPSALGRVAGRDALPAVHGDQRAALGRGRRGLRRRLRPSQLGALDPAQWLSAPRPGHPGRHDRGGDPQAPASSYFPEGVLERRKRAEAALISVVATCYLLGVSTRRMDKLVQTLGITSLSKSQVSRMAADLDEQVTAFRARPLADAGPFTFVAADAL